jgi:uncharacterized membrane protein HdeD (DUF308 family)
LIVLGIVAIAVPNVSTIVAETWIALILSSAGVAKAVYAFQNPRSRRFHLETLIKRSLHRHRRDAILLPLTGVLTLTLLLGSFLLTEGVFNLILAFRVRPQQNWTWVLTDGIITLVLGA